MKERDFDNHIRKESCSAAAAVLKKLERPQGKIDVVLDTDTFNEADDQFALSYLVKSGGNLNIVGLFAAPFYNFRVRSPKEGMEKSYEEILKLLRMLGREDLCSTVRRGSDRYLPSEEEAVESEAADTLIELAMQHSEENPLYVVNIACITNLASALLKKPEIKERIVVLWLGGHSFEWPDTHEFNMFQDIAAARVVMASGAPVVLFPCMGVVSAFSVSGQDLDRWLKGKNELCDYLTKGVDDYVAAAYEPGEFWSKPIWDVVPIGWLKGEYTLDRFEISPLPSYDCQWERDNSRHLIRYVYHVRKDKLMADLFTTLSM